MPRSDLPPERLRSACASAVLVAATLWRVIVHLVGAGILLILLVGLITHDAGIGWPIVVLVRAPGGPPGVFCGGPPNASRGGATVTTIPRAGGVGRRYRS
jgi:hypothetical protein